MFPLVKLYVAMNPLESILQMKNSGPMATNAIRDNNER